MVAPAIVIAVLVATVWLAAARRRRRRETLALKGQRVRARVREIRRNGERWSVSCRFKHPASGIDCTLGTLVSTDPRPHVADGAITVVVDRADPLLYALEM